MEYIINYLLQIYEHVTVLLVQIKYYEDDTSLFVFLILFYKNLEKNEQPFIQYVRKLCNVEVPKVTMAGFKVAWSVGTLTLSRRETRVTSQ